MTSIQTASLVWHNSGLVAKEKLSQLFDIDLFVSTNGVEIFFTNGTEIMFCEETLSRIRSMLSVYNFHSTLFSDSSGEILCNEVRRLLIRNFCYKVARCFYLFSKGSSGKKTNEFIFVEPNPSLFSTDKVVKKAIVSNNFLKPSGSAMNLPTIENEFRKIIRSEIELTDAEDCIILDQQQNILESYLGNIFLINGKEVLTSSYDSGCTLHLLRKVVINTFREMGFDVIEKKPLHIEDLLDAREVIVAGSSGIFSLKGFEYKRYFEDTRKLLIERLLSAS